MNILAIRAQQKQSTACNRIYLGHCKRIRCESKFRGISFGYLIYANVTC